MEYFARQPFLPTTHNRPIPPTTTPTPTPNPSYPHPHHPTTPTSPPTPPQPTPHTPHPHPHPTATPPSLTYVFFDNKRAMRCLTARENNTSSKYPEITGKNRSPTQYLVTRNCAFTCGLGMVVSGEDLKQYELLKRTPTQYTTPRTSEVFSTSTASQGAFEGMIDVDTEGHM